MLGKTPKNDKISKIHILKLSWKLVSVIDIYIYDQEQKHHKQRYIGRFDIWILKIINMNFESV